MFTRTIKVTAIVFASLLSIASGGRVSCGDPPKAQVEGVKAGEAEKKLRERLEVLEEIARLELAAFKGGQATYGSVLSARQDVVQATLELTKDPAKRVEALAEHVKITKEIEEAAKRLVEAKQAPGVGLLRAKAARLKAEADLAEEQSRFKSPTK
jgi:outer membrane protein TolC